MHCFNFLEMPCPRHQLGLLHSGKAQLDTLISRDASPIGVTVTQVDAIAMPHFSQAECIVQGCCSLLTPMPGRQDIWTIACTHMTDCAVCQHASGPARSDMVPLWKVRASCLRVRKEPPPPTSSHGLIFIKLLGECHTAFSS